MALLEGEWLFMCSSQDKNLDFWILDFKRLPRIGSTSIYEVKINHFSFP